MVGEYIAVEKLEVAYLDSSAVEQIWVYGTSTESYVIAVVVPDKRVLASWAAENGVEGDYEAQCRDKKVRGSITARCESVTFCDFCEDTS